MSRKVYCFLHYSWKYDYLPYWTRPNRCLLCQLSQPPLDLSRSLLHRPQHKLRHLKPQGWCSPWQLDKQNQQDLDKNKSQTCPWHSILPYWRGSSNRLGPRRLLLSRFSKQYPRCWMPTLLVKCQDELRCGSILQPFLEDKIIYFSLFPRWFGLELFLYHRLWDWEQDRAYLWLLEAIIGGRGIV